MTPSRLNLKRLSGALLAAALFVPSAQALDLLQTWEQARQHDPQMQVVQATRSTVQAYEAQAHSLWRPVVMGSATVGAMSSETRTTGAQFAVGGQPPMPGSFATSASAALSTRWSLQAKQPLYSPERQAQQAQLQHAAGVAEWRADLAQQQFMLLTVQRYFNVLLAERQLQVLKSQHVAVQRSLTEAQDRFAIGDLPVTDTHEAAARASGLQAQWLAADSELQMARQVLAESTRLPTETLKPLTPKAAESAAASPPLDQVLAQVREANTGLRLKKAQWDVARQEVKKHQARGGITLDLVAQAGRDRLSGDGDFGPASNTQSQQMVGLSLNVPLYTGGYRSAKLQEAVSAQAQAEAEYELTVQQTQQQARSVWLALQTGPARLSALQASWKASTARLDATRLGRQVGDRTTLDLLQAQNDAAQSELGWLRAQTELLLTRLQLDALTGSLSVQSLQGLNAQLAP
ncbi:TolC family protein [Limnohabitans sp. 2KL-51]|uniref:TolC family protein n=1 Tax=Limnohabitans sp. 2KL-51 TaxID=1977911 RepID=UPI000D39FF70|nr:TolC family protein [Limnohabitans sp. 2KL-51]PUE48408.1 transporter [Limnohabitans sp. 2KL-51]